MHDGNFLKFGGSINYHMTINWLDFGFHRSKGEVTTGCLPSKTNFDSGSQQTHSDQVLLSDSHSFVLPKTDVVSKSLESVPKQFLFLFETKCQRNQGQTSTIKIFLKLMHGYNNPWRIETVWKKHVEFWLPRLLQPFMFTRESGNFFKTGGPLKIWSRSNAS